MSTSPKKSRYEKELGEFDRSVCILCQQSSEDEEVYGKMLKKAGITVHYFCMLFSSGLSQNGASEKEGVFGFLPEDILKEVKRGSRLKCIYCKKKGATIGCVVKSCRKVFHFGCGRKSSTLHQFFDTYRSYCPDHRPRQQCNVSDRLAFFGTALSTCAICMNAVEARASNETLRAPCCKNAWYHRLCVQKHASTAGLYFFKCPLCNNKEIFQTEMLTYGIYLPDQDAAWEQEPNAFGDLLERYKHCDAKKCKCLEGREWNNDGSKWEIILCDWCGSQGSHVECKFLLKIGKYDICPSCKEIDEREKAHKKESKAPVKRKTPEKKTRKSVESFEEGSPSKDKSPYPGPCRQLRKTGLPTPERLGTSSHFSSSSPTSSSSFVSGRRSKNVSPSLSIMNSPRPSASEFGKMGRSSTKSPSSHSLRRSLSSTQFGREVQDSYSHSGRKSRNTSPSLTLLNLSRSSLSQSGKENRRTSDSPSNSTVRSLSSIQSGRKSTLVSPSTSGLFSGSSSSSLQFDRRGRSRSERKSESGRDKSPNTTHRGSSLYRGEVSKGAPKRALVFQTDNDAVITESLPTSPVDREYRSPEKPKKSPGRFSKSLESPNKSPGRSEKTPGRHRKSPGRSRKSEIVQIENSKCQQLAESDSLKPALGSEKYKSKSQESLSSSSKHRQSRLSQKSRTANKEKVKENSTSPIIPNQNTLKKLLVFSSESSLQKSSAEKYKQQGQLKRKLTNSLKTPLLSPHMKVQNILANASPRSPARKMSPRKVTHSNSGSLRSKVSAQNVDVVGFEDDEQEVNVHQVEDFNHENLQDLSLQKLSTGKVAKRAQRKSRSTINIQGLSAQSSSVIAQDPTSTWKWKNRNVRSTLFINDSNTSIKMTSTARNSSVICTPDGSFAEYNSSLDVSPESFSTSDAGVLPSTAESEFKTDYIPSKRTKKSRSKKTVKDSSQTSGVGESELNRSSDLQPSSHMRKRKGNKWEHRKRKKYIKKAVNRAEIMDVDLEDTPFRSLTKVDMTGRSQEHPQENVSTIENKDMTGHVPKKNLMKITNELKKKMSTQQETNLVSSKVVGQSNPLLHSVRKHKDSSVKSGEKNEDSELSQQQKDSPNKQSEPKSTKEESFLKTLVEGTRNASIACQRGLKRKRKRSLEEMGQFTLNKWLKEGKVGLPNCGQKHDCHKQEKSIHVLQDQHIQGLDPIVTKAKTSDLVLKWRGKTFIVKKNPLVEAKEAQETLSLTKTAHLKKNTVDSENYLKSKITNVEKSIADVLSTGKAIGKRDSIVFSSTAQDTDDNGLINSKGGMSSLSREALLADLSHDFRVTRQMVNSSEFRMADSKQPSLQCKIDGQGDDLVDGDRGDVVDGDVRTEMEESDKKTTARSVEVAQAKKEFTLTSKRLKVSNDTKTIQHTEKEEEEDMEDDTRKLTNLEKPETSDMEVIDFDEFLKICNSNSEGKLSEDTVSAITFPEKEQVLLTEELNKSIDYFDFSGQENHVTDQEKTFVTHTSESHGKHQDTDMKNNIDSKEDGNSVSDKGVMLEYYTHNEEKVVTLVCTPHKLVSC